MSKKKVTRGFNNASANYTFDISFNADLSLKDIQALAQSLKLTTVRPDDWADTLAFRVVEKKTTLVLSRNDLGQYKIRASASDKAGLKALAPLYDDCLKAIDAIGGKMEAQKNFSKPKAPRS